MINFDNAIKENIKEHNSNLPEVPNQSQMLLINGGSGSGSLICIQSNKSVTTYYLFIC